MIFGSEADLNIAIKLARGRKLAFQAGGNCGVWANHLAKLFERVVTAEPDEDNFECLALNKRENVTALQYALGDRPSMVGLERDASNIGAHFVKGEGVIPQITIDSLSLPACDLLSLDIEGMESHALDGARETIAKFKPVLIIEDKGLSEQYGVPKGWTEGIEGYRVTHRVHRDVIMVPSD